LITSQWLTTVYASILLLQGFVEWRKETSSVSSTEDDLGNRNNRKEMDQILSSSLQAYDSDTIDGIRWAFASFASLTPTSHLLLLQMKENIQGDTEKEILYGLGDFSSMNRSTMDNAQGIESAIKIVFEESRGRVAIGSSHPAAVQLLPEPFRRCVLLQRIDLKSKNTKPEKVRLCLMTGSNNILESYTKNDLKWLGRLAEYIAINLN